MQVKYPTVVVIARGGVLYVLYFRRHFSIMCPLKTPGEVIHEHRKHEPVCISGEKPFEAELLYTPLQ